MPSWKKQRPKVRGKKDVIDEYETMDVDRDEQKVILKSREKRWKEIKLQQQRERQAEKKALDNAEKMDPNLRSPLTELELAWLRYDYVLANVMERNAHIFFDSIRKKDIKSWHVLLDIFMSKNMRKNIETWLSYFDHGGMVKSKIKLIEVIKEYRKLKGIKTKIKVMRKGEKEYVL